MRFKPLTFLTFVSVSLLSGCSSLNSGYECPNKAGTMCKSLDQINTMVDQGDIRGKSEESKQAHISPPFVPYVSSHSVSLASPMRHPEKFQRIWVSGYEDEEENYHQDHYLYAVTDKGYWVEAKLNS